MLLLQAAKGGSALTANPDGNLRDIYYARYIDWFFTTPLLLLDIILLAGLPLGVTLWWVFHINLQQCLAYIHNNSHNTLVFVVIDLRQAGHVIRSDFRV